MWSDLRFALRTLRRAPVFTGVAVLSLALGIGANTSIFSLLYQVLFRSLPVRGPESLVVFHTKGQDPGWGMSDTGEAVFSYPLYKDLRDRNTVFSGVVARNGERVSVTWQGQSELARAEMVSGNLFEVLGLHAWLGRTLTPADDLTPGGHPVAVLSYGYWMRRFGGRPDVLNQKINLNGNPMVVVGVAPPSYHGLISGTAPDLFVPVTMKAAVTPTLVELENRRMRFLNLFGRLKPGVSARQAEAGLQVVWRLLRQEELARLGRMRSPRAEQDFLNTRLELRPASQGINSLGSRWRTPLIALMAMVGLVLLIACANIANLLLARAAARRKEIAVRLALGGSRFRIARQVLIESLSVSVASGLLGLALSDWTTTGLLALLPEGMGGGWVAAEMNLRLLAFALLVAVATGVLFGVAPALQASRTGVALTLKDQAAATAGGAQARLRRALVVGQIALSLVLLIGAGLFARTLFNLLQVNLGFRPERLLTFSVDASLSGYDQRRGVALYQELQRRLAALPGVTAVGAVNPGPLSNSDYGTNLTIEGYQAKDDEEAGASMSFAGPGYFQAVGIPLVAGREFTERDVAGAPQAAMVNQEFVRRYFAGGHALGRHLAFSRTNGPLGWEIVGVVANNIHSGLRERPKPFAFIPFAQDERLRRLSFFVRSARDDLAAQVRRAVHDVDPNLPVFRLEPMRVVVGDSLYAERLVAILSSAFGVLATLLAALGLYGVVAYTVTRRTAEIGVRVALGALPSDVLRMVLKEAGLMAAAGIVIGLPAAFLLGRLVESQLFGLKASDPPVFAAAALVLGLVALGAALIPGRRAARIDPMRALRYE